MYITNVEATYNNTFQEYRDYHDRQYYNEYNCLNQESYYYDICNSKIHESLFNSTLYKLAFYGLFVLLYLDFFV
jgi:hypothetical protein